MEGKIVMSKGLKALKEIRDTYIDSWYGVHRCEIIEKELKQAEENEKLLDTFKNALTIEHHDYPMAELDHSRDVLSYFVKELTTIKQNELDKSMRKALREWVLKNAFPKELKALEIIKRCKDVISLNEEYDEELYSQEEIEKEGGQKYYLEDGSDGYMRYEIAKEEYNLLKEVLL